MFEFTSENIETIISWFGTLFTAFKPVLLLIFGVYFGVFIAEMLINFMKAKIEARRRIQELEEEEEAEAEESVLAPVFKRYHEHRREVAKEKAREEIFKEA